MSEKNKKDITSGKIAVSRPTVSLARKGQSVNSDLRKTGGTEKEKTSIHGTPGKTPPKNEGKSADVSAKNISVVSGEKAGSVGAQLRNAKIGEIWKADNGDNRAGRMLERGSVDFPLLAIITVLAIYGLTMVFSASYAYAYSTEQNSYHFIQSQILYFIAGAIAAGLIIAFYDKFLNWNWIPKFVMLYLVFCIGLLVLIFVPGLGVMEGETKRWLKIGPVSLQPSEFAKGALILFLALYYTKYGKKFKKLKLGGNLILGTFIPYLLSAVIIVLVFLENHTSGTIILGLIAIMMVFMGERKHVFTVTALVVGLTVVVAAISYLMQFDTPEKKQEAPELIKKIVTHYSWKRIEIWLRPENFSIKDELWQTTQGIYAIGSGGFMGVGFGQSRQKHLFVSQPQNDFIFTIVCEELGFVGAVIVVVLFIALIWRGFKVGARIPDTFSRMTVWGLTASITMQAFLNMAVVTNILPNTGISLPFFSYGGSSILSLMIEVGIILALSRYAKKQ